MKIYRDLVSVFIPYYNDEKFLKQSIESILQQTYENIEIILLNHFCTDLSREIAHSYKDKRIKHIDMPYNLGAGSFLLLKEGLKVAKGKYIKLFCADDVMLPNCIETFVSYMENNPEITFAFSDMDYIDNDSKKLNFKWSQEKEGYKIYRDDISAMRNLFNGENHLPYPASFLKIDALIGIDLNVTLYRVVDMLLWLTILINKGKIGFLDDVLVLYRIHENQLSSIQHLETAIKSGFYELHLFYEAFYNIKDVNTICKLFVDSAFIKKMNEEDVEYIPFIVSEVCMHFQHKYHYGYKKLSEILSDNSMREKIREKFGYTIEDFRKQYSDTFINIKDTDKVNQKYSILAKLKVYANRNIPTNTNLSALLYLLIRKIYLIIRNIITFRYFRKKKKINKTRTYTV